jgi:hypothetical protein
MHMALTDSAMRGEGEGERERGGRRIASSGKQLVQIERASGEAGYAEPPPQRYVVLKM